MRYPHKNIYEKYLGVKIIDTFIVLTENTYKELDQLDKKKCKIIEYKYLVKDGKKDY